MVDRFRWSGGKHPLAIKAIVQRQRDETDRLERLREAAEEEESQTFSVADAKKPDEAQKGD